MVKAGLRRLVVKYTKRGDGQVDFFSTAAKWALEEVYKGEFDYV